MRQWLCGYCQKWVPTALSVHQHLKDEPFVVSVLPAPNRDISIKYEDYHRTGTEPVREVL